MSCFRCLYSTRRGVLFVLCGCRARLADVFALCSEYHSLWNRVVSVYTTCRNVRVITVVRCRLVSFLQRNTAIVYHKTVDLPMVTKCAGRGVGKGGCYLMPCIESASPELGAAGVLLQAYSKCHNSEVPIIWMCSRPLPPKERESVCGDLLLAPFPRINCCSYVTYLWSKRDLYLRLW